jgi:hypothetical protein
VSGPKSTAQATLWLANLEKEPEVTRVALRRTKLLLQQRNLGELASRAENEPTAHSLHTGATSAS